MSPLPTPTRRSDPSEFDRVREWANLHLRELLRDYAPEAFAKLRGNRCPCPMHGGEDPNLALFDNPTGSGELWRCHSACGTTGGGVELVQRLTGRTGKAGALEVLRELAPRAGVLLEARPAARARTTSAPRLPAKPAPVSRPLPPEPEEPDPCAVLREMGMVPASRAYVQQYLLDLLTLGPEGRAYLAERGFDPDAAAAFGFRSVPTATAWALVVSALREEFLPEEMARAGLAHLPTTLAPVLVIPYTDPTGAPWTVRVRSIEGKEYRSLRGDAARWPFHARVLDGLGPDDELHLVEGEFNAYTLHTYGLRACSPGAAGTWHPDWTARVARAGRVVAWYDDDTAGEKGALALGTALLEVLTRDAVRARVKRQRIPQEDGRKIDLNDLHRRGELAPYLERAAWRT